jgi:[acyl-carrier-protein] S-malonyltransferase
LATFVLSLVVLDAVERIGVEPTRSAGHSLGEYSALAAAGVIGLEDSVALVAERGDAMQAAAEANPGVMTLVGGCDADTVDIACRLAGGDVWVANFNSDTETVIAGEEQAVARAAEIALDMGARRTERVPVGGPFHTPLMAGARSRLTKALSSVRMHDAEVPVVTNVDARFHTRAKDFEALLCAQLTSPVRWRQSVLRLAGMSDVALDEQLLDSGRLIFVEMGPGQSLSSMIGQTIPAATTVAVRCPDDLDLLVETLSADPSVHAYALEHQGEHIYVSERVVISPATGVFEPSPVLAEPDGLALQVGTVVGWVSGQEVCSPFAGTLKGILAHPGERVTAGQPIAWLHAS